ncbi:MAG: flavin reductase family protein [Candidatus Omnitrophica bacterium]|nr:flavin reductase family protein [Candidatus Omnitrophota bacterium]
MELNLKKWYRILAPRPVVLVSTVSSEGISNAAPFSFVTPVSSDPPLIAFASSPKHETAKNILDTGDFVVNLPSKDIVRQLWICADSIPDNESEIDAAKLTAEKSLKVRSPGIKECFARYECELESHHAAGDHLLIIGRILRVDVKDDLMEGEKFLVEKSGFLMHIEGPEFGLLGEVVKVK